MTSPKDGGSGLEEALAWAERSAKNGFLGKIPEVAILAAEVRRYQAQAPAIEALIEALERISVYTDQHDAQDTADIAIAALAAVRGGSK
jgi:hypothetical protein